MSTFTPQYGETVFSRSGHKGVYLARTPCGWHAVAQLVVVDVEHGEPCDYGYETTEWQHVYAEAPAKVVDSEILAREAKLAEVAKELSDLNRQKFELKQGYDDTLARLAKKHQALQYVEDFLDGNITHYVCTEEYASPMLISMEETKADPRDESQWKHAYRLLSLFGRSKGDLQWKLSQYTAGSCNNPREVQPCRSRDEAFTLMRDLVGQRLKVWLENPIRDYRMTTLEKQCYEAAISPPPELKAAVLESRKTEATRNLETAEAALEKARKQLESLTGKEVA